MKSHFIFTLLFLFAFSVVKAQEPAAGETSAPNNLVNQFNNLKDNSNSYQEYKVIRLTSLNSFWKSVQDSINATEAELVQARGSIQAQNEKVLSLEQENAQKDKEVQQSAYDIENISVLGMDMQKQSYLALSWGIIIILLIILGIFAYLYKNSQLVTTEKRKAFEEVDQEFNEYKIKAREKELRIKRELQTEMNRAEELTQQIALLKKQTHM